MAFTGLKGRRKFTLKIFTCVFALIAGALYLRYVVVTRITLYNPEPILKAVEAANSRYMTEERQRAFEKLQQALHAMPDTASSRPEWVESSSISPNIYHKTESWRLDWDRSFSLVKEARQLSDTLYIPNRLYHKGVKVEIRTRDLSYALSAEAYRKVSAGKVNEALEYADLAMWVGTGLAIGAGYRPILSEICRGYNIHVLLLSMIEEKIELDGINRIRNTILPYGKKDIWVHNKKEEILKMRLLKITFNEISEIKSGTLRNKIWLAALGKNWLSRKIENFWNCYNKWGEISWADVLEERRDVLPTAPMWFPIDDWPAVRWGEKGAAFEMDPAEKQVMTVVLNLTVSQYEDIARFSLLEAVLAVETYFIKNGKLPESLKDLVPEYSENVFDDPFSVEELIYRKHNNGYIVYSVGPNGIDNGGIIKTNENIAIGAATTHKRWFDVSKDFVVKRSLINN